MSIESEFIAERQFISNAYNMLERGGADLINIDKNIDNISPKIRERYLDFMNNGTDTIWNNWEKVLATDVTEASMQNTVKAPMKSVLKGNTSQEGTPTPDSPSNVEVVTGENTITITKSDNTQSQNYPLSLGNIELAKIGTYQDKLFHAVEGNPVYDSLSSEVKATLTEGDWYKRTEIGKVVLDGTENWDLTGTNSEYRCYVSSINMNSIQNPSSSSINYGYCNYFKANYVIGSNTAIGIRYYEESSTSAIITAREKNMRTITEFKQLLSSNNLLLYGILKDPTYTQITDTTLISQLEAIEKAKAYDNETNISQTNTELPFYLDLTALKNV